MNDNNMRYCFGENVSVYEVSGDVVSELLKKTAEQVSELEASSSWFNLTLGPTPGGYGSTYTLTLYSH